MTKKELFWQNPQTITLLTQSLEQKRVSITSTDTIYGFLANTTQNSTLAIQKLKELSTPRPYLILIRPEALSLFVDTATLTPQMNNVIKHCWPGPLTIIFTAKSTVPAHLRSPLGTIALRCPNHAGLQQLLTHFDGLFSTSANKAMEPAPDNAEQINPELLANTDYLVHDAQKEESESVASTIIDFSQPENVHLIKEKETQLPLLKIIRPGAYSKEKLEKYYYAK